MKTRLLFPVCECGRMMRLEKQNPYFIEKDGRVIGTFSCPDPACPYYDAGGYIPRDWPEWEEIIKKLEI